MIGAPTNYATLQDLSAYTPLSMFQPVTRNNQIYGGHRHVIADVDGLQDALDDMNRRVNLLREAINNIVNTIEFRVTFWSLDDVIVNDGQWRPDIGAMTA